MDKLEKAEKIREYAGVTYEEALSALEASGEDMLDAMLLLEKQGKTTGPNQSFYTTSYREQSNYIDVPGQVEQQKQAAPSFRRNVVGLFRTIFRFIRHTSFTISHHEKCLLRVPSWVMVLVFLIAWKAVLPVAAVALLFGIRYSFEGSENTESANSFLQGAADLAEEIKSKVNGNNKKKGDNT